MNILGISAFYHDSAAALVREGRVVAAAQEERFSRKKHDADFPAAAVRHCLDSTGLSIADIDAVVFYEKPLLKLDRILVTHLGCWPKAFRTFGEAQKVWVGGKIRIASVIRKRLGYDGPVLFTKHHEAHAASAFYSSPFESAAIVVADGVGEWATASLHEGRAGVVRPLEETKFPDSLGLFYSAFTDYLGFEVNDGEYKVMGLAPYGRPRFKEILLREFVRLDPDGTFRLKLENFAFVTTDRMLPFRTVERLLGFPRRSAADPLTDDHRDLAASVQSVLEDAMLAIVRRAVARTGIPRVALAGGVALNCTANAKILAMPEVEDLYIFPASGDAGGAVGAALHAYHAAFEKPRGSRAFESVALGPSYTDDEIEEILKFAGHPYRRLAAEEIAPVTARLLHEQNVVGWFQGALEFGPRALGGRSILADPTRLENWPRINRKVKFREDFRPFAPSVLAERAAEYFDLDGESPYMILVAANRTSRLPAVTHVDNSSRLHTVRRDSNPLYHELISEFAKLSGVPVLINTSFNTSGMPIVCTPQNAIQCFIEAELDALVMGSFLLKREDFPYLAARGTGARP